MTDPAKGSGPVAGGDIITGGPIDDPATADRSHPQGDGQPLTNPDGSPDVLPPRTAFPQEAPADRGTPQDQAAQDLSGQLETGRDNIREGRGDTQPNPALAEGGDSG